MRNNSNLDRVSTQFDKILLICFQDIERKRYYDRQCQTNKIQ